VLVEENRPKDIIAYVTARGMQAKVTVTLRGVACKNYFRARVWDQRRKGLRESESEKERESEERVREKVRESESERERDKKRETYREIDR
jgi:hypothetical protein